MKQKRDKHCDYAVLNLNGRCIAVCHYNQDSDYEYDCTGKKALSHEEIARQAIERAKKGVDI
jgi:hypothetical protein